MIMTKASEEKMLQKGLYRDNGKDENNNFFCGAYLLDYKMAFLIIRWAITLQLRPS
jgi:hypothetical protein